MYLVGLYTHCYYNFVSLQKFAVRHEVREGRSEVGTSCLFLCLRHVASQAEDHRERIAQATGSCSSRRSVFILAVRSVTVM